MITLGQLRRSLRDNPAKALRLLLPREDYVPAHFHVTEVGHVTKNFMDCGGTVRSTQACLLQAWVAHDTDHRITTDKLSTIIQAAQKVLPAMDLPVEIEFEDGLISQFSLTALRPGADSLELQLAAKHTACLAPDQCGVSAPTACCSGTGCC